MKKYSLSFNAYEWGAIAASVMIYVNEHPNVAAANDLVKCAQKMWALHDNEMSV